MGSHKTAISRKGPSAPLKFILSNEEVKEPILDYGCGKGADSKHLTSLNYNVTSYDPYWNPKIWMTKAIYIIRLYAIMS